MNERMQYPRGKLRRTGTKKKQQQESGGFIETLRRAMAAVQTVAERGSSDREKDSE